MSDRSEQRDLVEQLAKRIIQNSWECFGGKLNEGIIAAGIEMASKFDGIQLKREYVYQTSTKETSDAVKS